MGDSIASVELIFAELERELRDIRLTVNVKNYSILVRGPVNVTQPDGRLRSHQRQDDQGYSDNEILGYLHFR